MGSRIARALIVAALAALLGGSSASAAPTVTFYRSMGFSGSAGLYAYGLDYDPSDNTILVGDYWNYKVQRYSIKGALA
jgi:tripartite motif-containing protein 71